jgi:hypothetical protein
MTVISGLFGLLPSPAESAFGVPSPLWKIARSNGLLNTLTLCMSPAGGSIIIGEDYSEASVVSLSAQNGALSVRVRVSHRKQTNSTVSYLWTPLADPHQYQINITDFGTLWLPYLADRISLSLSLSISLAHSHHCYSAYRWQDRYARSSKRDTNQI